MSLLAYIQKMKEEGREVVVAEPRPKIIVNSENQEVKEALIDLGYEVLEHGVKLTAPPTLGSIMDIHYPYHVHEPKTRYRKRGIGITRRKR